MKKLLVLLLLLAASTAGAQQRVRGYVKKNGTYVAPYHRSNPDATQTNNYSTKGNVNPYTGKRGTRKASR